jgi:HK97 family phage prohead protease
MPNEIYRADLCRSAAFTLTRAESDEDDGLTIEGYGALFNSVTEINSWEGTFEEVIAPGAFKKSLRERTPIMQFDHGRHPLLGSVPMGRYTTVEEDARGLHVVGRLSDNWLVQPFRDAIADGGVSGMSFRFSVVREEWRDKDQKLIKEDELFDLLWRGPGDRGPLRRTLKEVRVSEVGPVVWPAYSDTEVGVRTRDDGARVVTLDLGRLKDHNPLEIARLARLVAIADRDSSADPAADAAAPDDAPESPDITEPHTTERSADEHPEPHSAPPAADPSAGQHSVSSRPVSPKERREQIRASYRAYRDRLLAIPTTD